MIMSGIMRAVAGDNVDKALKLLTRIAVALEEANDLERAKQLSEGKSRR